MKPAKKVLLGTTNPSKVKRFWDLLAGYSAEILTLADLGISEEPAETGQTPEENARIKAAFYGRYAEAVICNDSGLYFDSLPLEDPRQPGLNIRAPLGQRLNDEEMISHYSDLIRTLGGRVEAFYLDGVAVWREGALFSFQDPETARASLFEMVCQPSVERNPGWPLDSLSRNLSDGCYFTSGKKMTPGTSAEHILLGEYRAKLTDFLVRALELSATNGREEFSL